MWESTGTSVLSRTSFLVPSREPRLEIDSYHATWDSNLSVFMVQPKNLDSEETVEPKLCVRSVVRKSTSNQDDANDNGTIDTSDTADGFFDSIHIIQSSNTYWEDSTNPELSAYPILQLISQDQNDQDSEASILPDDESKANTQQPEMTITAQEALEAVEHLRNAARRESEQQKNLLSRLGNIHHFNWQCKPVMERSATPPELSLFIIQFTPKLWLRDTSRRAVTLRQAMKYIDPVVYTGPPECLYYGRKDFFKAMAGRVKRFYSEGGAWSKDDYGRDEERPVTDPMDLEAYTDAGWFPVNGWMRTGWARTYGEYKWILESMRMRAKDRKGPFKRPVLVRRASPLWQCMSAV